MYICIYYIHVYIHIYLYMYKPSPYLKVVASPIFPLRREGDRPIPLRAVVHVYMFVYMYIYL